jgi:N-acetylglucosamine kinase-like BadF-type ATPase
MPFSVPPQQLLTREAVASLQREVRAVDDSDLDEALTAAGRRRSDVVASVFGLAGVDWDSDVGLVEQALDALALPGERLVVNDSRIALRAGCSQPWPTESTPCWSSPSRRIRSP